MKILLINPPYASLKKINQHILSLSLPYLAAYLNQQGIVAKYINAEQTSMKNYFWKSAHEIYNHKIQKIYHKNLNNPNFIIWQMIKKEILLFKPDLVGITSTTSSHDSAEKTAQIVRKILPQARIVYGGPHATAKYKELVYNDLFDFIVRGEGEVTFYQLSKSLDLKEDLIKVNGLSYKTESRVVHNPNRSNIVNLDSIPSPQSFYDISKARYSCFSVITSRGCNNNCYYCATPFLWPGLKVRSIDNVIEELKEGIRVHKTRHVFFLDANFNFSKERVIKLCNSIIDEKLNLVWYALCNLNVIDEELAQIMKKSGCYEIYVGVEAGDDKTMKDINKKIKIDEIEKSISILKKTGILCNAFIMYGLPNQSINSMKATNRLLRQIKFDGISPSMFFPIPGSKFYETIMSKNETYLSDSDCSFNDFKSSFQYHNENKEFVSVIKNLKMILLKKKFGLFLKRIFIKFNLFKH
ncbi:B12-binding domain-containing radical SAM protein [Patescibacteria group bacterium]|nr:B12-binding domain-containing radical SAM protein [Patescibacteria group bacterium]